MVPSKRFKPVLRVTESREKAAARELGDSRRRQHEAEQRLAELREYHQDYLNRFKASSEAGISANQLKEYQAFLRKLELAIKEQEGLVVQSRQACAGAQTHWQQKHIRTRVMGKAMDRLVDNEKKQADKVEQKNLDERNNNRRGK